MVKDFFSSPSKDICARWLLSICVHKGKCFIIFSFEVNSYSITLPCFNFLPLIFRMPSVSLLGYGGHDENLVTVFDSVFRQMYFNECNREIMLIFIWHHSFVAIFHKNIDTVKPRTWRIRLLNVTKKNKYWIVLI